MPKPEDVREVLLSADRAAERVGNDEEAIADSSEIASTLSALGLIRRVPDLNESELQEVRRRTQEVMNEVLAG